jgi:hypothetical protein
MYDQLNAVARSRTRAADDEVARLAAAASDKSRLRQAVHDALNAVDMSDPGAGVSVMALAYEIESSTSGINYIIYALRDTGAAVSVGPRGARLWRWAGIKKEG